MSDAAAKTTWASCQTLNLKRAAAFVKPVLAAAVGTVHFVAITFHTPSGDFGLPDADLETAISYLEEAGPKINEYCSQYGTPSFLIDSSPIAFTADLGNGTTYTDAQLQAWVNQIIGQQQFGANDALVFFNPQGTENTDAPVSQGILGYHGAAPSPYSFVNVLGSGFTVDDQADIYALAFSHEIAEMIVDPAADLSKPEVCDGCAGNCGVDYRNYFGSDGSWLGGSRVAGYAFFTDGVATPATVAQCPAPWVGCIYDPAAPPQPQPSPPCVDILKKAVSEIEAGDYLGGIEDLGLGIECLLRQGLITDAENLLKRVERAVKSARATTGSPSTPGSSPRLWKIAR